MRVLVACEFSGVVRDAFAKKGHYAVSCDYLPSERPDGMHHQGNVMDIIDDRWDLMIAHPPCTYLANSGVQWLTNQRLNERDRDIRWMRMLEACVFFNALLGANIPRIAVENPIMHKYARERITAPYTQIIHPWQHGHDESKRSCYWLKNLPCLKPSKIVTPVKQTHWLTCDKKDRWKDRSRTLEGIAAAMAEQWSNL